LNYTYIFIINNRIPFQSHHTPVYSLR